MARTQYHVFKLDASNEDDTVEIWQLARAVVEAHSPRAAIKTVTEDLASAPDGPDPSGTYAATPAGSWTIERDVKIDRKPRALFAS